MSDTSSMDKPTQGDMDIVNMMLYAKDRFSVSGSAYHEMAQACRQMPRHYKLKERIRELNQLWNISPTPNGAQLLIVNEGNRALVIFKTDENYEGLNNALKDLRSEVERLK